MTFTDIENLLAERLGFDVETIGRAAVEALIRRSMERAGVPDAAAYALLVTKDSEAWNALVERMVIPETWFFRDVAPFELAVERALLRTRRATGKPFRILSCPCSTGEEPYSLVMALLQAGVPSGSFVIDAVDVSRHALDTTRQAVFHKRSFRNDRIRDCEPYFNDAEIHGARRLKESVAAQVRFQEGNLIASGFLQDEPPYDVVFCRNLLIYFHREARMLGMAALRRLVADDGILVVGHAEAILARENGFKAAGTPAAFAFAKAVAAPVQQPKVASRPEPAAEVESPKATRDSSVHARSDGSSDPSRFEPPTAHVALLATESEISELMIARSFGDAGRLAEAIAACSRHLQQVPDSVEAHFLMGVFYDALGRADLAASYFRKALYLDPVHREALLHLALKQEALGDGSGAALLRARAERAQGSGTRERE